MNTCWNCGRPLADGVAECEYGCGERMTDEDARKFALFLQQLGRRRRLDWTKVQSLADVICVLSSLFSEAAVDPESPAAEKLERFLEPKKED